MAWGRQGATRGCMRRIQTTGNSDTAIRNSIAELAPPPRCSDYRLIVEWLYGLTARLTQSAVTTPTVPPRARIDRPFRHARVPRVYAQCGIQERPLSPAFCRAYRVVDYWLPVAPWSHRYSKSYWRRRSESNRRRRLCRPLHDHSATPPGDAHRTTGPHCLAAAWSRYDTMNAKGSARAPLKKLERETSLELATSTLARLRSTN